MHEASKSAADETSARQRKYAGLQASRERRARMAGRHIDDDDPRDTPDMLAAFLRKSRLARSFTASTPPKKKRKPNTATHRWCSGCHRLLKHDRFKRTTNPDGTTRFGWRCLPCSKDYARQEYARRPSDHRRLSKERQRRYRARKKQEQK